MSATATRRMLDFASIVFVVLVLVPSGAHLLEMPNKLALAPDDYMVAQRSYDGWWYAGLVIPPALFLVAAQLVLRWRQRAAIGAALASFACLAAAHAIFWMFTFPANQASLSWTAKPSDFERVRAQWEWSHGAGALLNLAAFAALLWAVLLEPERSHAQLTATRRYPGPGAPRPRQHPASARTSRRAPRAPRP